MLMLFGSLHSSIALEASSTGPDQQIVPA